MFVGFFTQDEKLTESHTWQICETSLMSGIFQCNVAVYTYIVD